MVEDSFTINYNIFYINNNKKNILKIKVNFWTSSYLEWLEVTKICTNYGNLY